MSIVPWWFSLLWDFNQGTHVQGLGVGSLPSTNPDLCGPGSAQTKRKRGVWACRGSPVLNCCSLPECKVQDKTEMGKRGLGAPAPFLLLGVKKVKSWILETALLHWQQPSQERNFLGILDISMARRWGSQQEAWICSGFCDNFWTSRRISEIARLHWKTCHRLRNGAVASELRQSYNWVLKCYNQYSPDDLMYVGRFRSTRRNCI